jgi:hypothetical protein
LMFRAARASLSSRLMCMAVTGTHVFVEDHDE